MKKNFKMFLIEKLNESKNNLVKNVVSDLLYLNLNNKELFAHCNDIVNKGCSSGCVNSLIYYSDTENFFKENCVEIINLIQEYKDNTGTIDSLSFCSNDLAWFSYENVVYTLLDEFSEIYNKETKEEE